MAFDNMREEDRTEISTVEEIVNNRDWYACCGFIQRLFVPLNQTPRAVGGSTPLARRTVRAPHRERPKTDRLAINPH